MTHKEQIENHNAWKYISSLSNAERYTALFGKSQHLTEKCFNVKIEEWPFTRMNEIPKEWAYVSVTDPFRNTSFIAVLKPNVV